MANSRVAVLVDLPPEPLWDLLSDFRGWNKWHRRVAVSRMEDGISEGLAAPGVIRSVGELDDLLVRIKWLACDEERLEIAFTSLPPASKGHLPFAARNFVVRVKLIPLTDSERTVVEWTSQFGAELAEEAETRSYLEGLHHMFITEFLVEGARKQRASTEMREFQKAFELRVQPV
jgi:hypothetical protein